MNREMDLERLVSHRFPLSRVRRRLELAAHPQPSSMKIMIQPRFVGWQYPGRKPAVNGKMTAAVLYGKEDVKIEKVPIPRVGDGEVLVKVQVALDLRHRPESLSARLSCPHDRPPCPVWP